jgi:hypothetical protein
VPVHIGLLSLVSNRVWAARTATVLVRGPRPLGTVVFGMELSPPPRPSLGDGERDGVISSPGQAEPW